MQFQIYRWFWGIVYCFSLEASSHLLKTHQGEFSPKACLPSLPIPLQQGEVGRFREEWLHFGCRE